MNRLLVSDGHTGIGSLPIDRNPYCHRTLGMNWLVETDVFKFVSCEPDTVIFRSVLAFDASIYDLLGFLGPILLPGRLLLQDLARERVAWDGLLSEAQIDEWRSWIENLRNLDYMQFPRCTKPPNFIASVKELHIFSDASERGYGVVAYFHPIAQCRTIRCSFFDGQIPSGSSEVHHDSALGTNRRFDGRQTLLVFEEGNRLKHRYCNSMDRLVNSLRISD